MRSYCLFLTLIIVLTGTTGQTAAAYTEETWGGNLIATMSPAQPKAGEEVTIKLTSYEVDLDIAPIEWTVDEEVVASGIGLKQYTLTAGKNGDIKGVVAKVTKPGGGQISKIIGFQDSSLSITYSSDSYTPPFYRGHSLPGPGSTVTVAAVPTIYDELGNLLPPGKLLFQWKIGGATLVAASGLGKSTAKIKLGSLFSETALTVIVSDPTSGNKVEKRIVLRAEEPKLVFYRADPLLGIEYNQAIKEGYKLAAGEETFQVEPYFFSLSSWLTGKLSYLWTINGQEASESGNSQQAITISRPETGSGKATLDVTVTNEETTAQNASRNLHFQY